MFFQSFSFAPCIALLLPIPQKHSRNVKEMRLGISILDSLRLYHIFTYLFRSLLTFIAFQFIGILGLYRIETLACTSSAEPIESKPWSVHQVIDQNCRRCFLIKTAVSSPEFKNHRPTILIRSLFIKVSICSFFGIWEGIAPKLLEILLDETTIIDPGVPLYRLHISYTCQGFDSVEANYVMILPCSFSQGFDSIEFILGVHSRVSIL